LVILFPTYKDYGRRFTRFNVLGQKIQGSFIILLRLSFCLILLAINISTLIFHDIIFCASLYLYVVFLEGRKLETREEPAVKNRWKLMKKFPIMFPLFHEEDTQIRTHQILAQVYSSHIQPTPDLPNVVSIYNHTYSYLMFPSPIFFTTFRTITVNFEDNLLTLTFFIIYWERIETPKDFVPRVLNC
jgi:hypothetical protein